MARLNEFGRAASAAVRGWAASLSTAPGRFARRSRDFWPETQGATAVQAIILMPAIVFFFAAGVLLWETVNIRKDLHYGTFQAMRYLSLYPPRLQADWEPVARKIIEAELLSNPWINKPLNEANFDVIVRFVNFNECGDEFTVEATYRLFAPTGSQSASGSSGILPSRDQLILREERNGKVVCD